MKIVLIYMILFLFLGCNEKTKVGYFAPTKYQQQSIINTQRDEFTIDNKRYLVLTTYISSIKSDFTTKEKEEFLVAIYQDARKQDKLTISNITLNGKKKDIFVKPLEKDDVRLKFSPLENRWTSYFLISAPPIELPILTLRYEIDHSCRVLLTFPKEL